MGRKSITVSVKVAFIKGARRLEPEARQGLAMGAQCGTDILPYPWEGWGHCLRV